MFITNTNTKKTQLASTYGNLSKLNCEVEGRTLFYNNIKSVSASLGELEILIKEKKPSIIALTETWFQNNNDVTLHCFEVYQKPFTSIRNEQWGGGIAIFVSECLQAELVHIDKNFESVSVKVRKKAKSLFPASTINLRKTKTTI